MTSNLPAHLESIPFKTREQLTDELVGVERQIASLSELLPKDSSPVFERIGNKAFLVSGGDANRDLRMWQLLDEFELERDLILLALSK